VLNFSDISKDVTRITNYYSAKEREPVISTEVLINRLKITYFIYLISESLDDTSMASDYDDMKKDIEQKDSIKQYLKTYKLRPGNTISEDLIEFLTTKNINGNRFVTYQKDFFSLLETINSSDIDGRYSILAPMTFVLNLSPNSINLLEKINDFNQKIDLNVLDYSWNHILSSGEEAMLNQYSEIYDEHPNFKASESICFVIDEGELYLHPEWQKTYLKALVIFLNYVCNAKASKQLILTSHSPFIVSDLPNSNLIFLDIKNGKTFVHNKFEVGNTFGGNILALFANSFFLSSFMGDYAKMMIDDVINYINGKPSKYIKDKSDAIKIIDLIGESIIKDQLIKMLDRMRIKDLETRVDHLEGK
jgi:hypothetical protein